MNSKKKILKVSTLKRHLSQLRLKNKKIGFTNGCFDILHVGHIQYLEKAKKQNQVLVVGLNSDRSIRQIKGPRRPINKQEHRSVLLAALQSVDYVTIFDEETPYDLIKAIKPHVLYKGADWKDKEVVGADIVEAYGGHVELIEYISLYSTTKFIESILKKHQKQ